ncbi:MAG TPA: hypothetical protein VK817_14100 [Trebonia sp.]|jgi:hypothetical protein|nr:hypothetical protein [Trebonia sp.]
MTPRLPTEPRTRASVVPGTLHADVALAVAGPRISALLLGAACVAWTATPTVRSGWASFTLVISIIAVVAGALRLMLADVPEPEDQYFLSVPLRAWLWFLAVLRVPPWEEVAVVMLVWLEVIHPARPWHTFALGAGLVAYLLTVHIAESGTKPSRLLRSHAKILISGACLMAIAAGTAMLPAGAPGAGSALLRVIAAIAIVLAAALVLPS